MKTTLVITSEHPILNHHRVHGHRILPGLSYIDLIFRALSKQQLSWQEYVLEDVAIFRPLIVAPKQQLSLEIACLAQPQGWQIKVQGQYSDAQTTVEFVTAKLMPKPAQGEVPELPQPFEPKRTIALEQVYGHMRTLELVHSDFMKAKGAVAIDEKDNALLRFETQSPGAAPWFSPVVLDASGVSSLHLLQQRFGAFKDSLFLPLHYGQFYALAPLQSSGFCYIPAASFSVKNDVMTCDMYFYSLTGELLGWLKKSVIKQVRDVGLNIARSQSETPSAPVAIAAQALEGESVEAFVCRVLANAIGCEASAINTAQGYYELGLESSQVLGLVATLEKQYQLSLSPTLLFEYTTVAELAAYLEQQLSGSSAQVEQQLASAAEHQPKPTGHKIAVIGMAGNYPQADDLGQLWQNLKDGVNAISELDSGRWSADVYGDLQSPSGKPLSRWGGFIARPDLFDPGFFNIAPREAAKIDPQERLFLQVAWHAIEDAGYTPQTLVSAKGPTKRRRCSVYVGCMHNDYQYIATQAREQGIYASVTLNTCQIANRVSYCFDFHGPSLTVDTGCSSSLTALHFAMMSLRSGESDAAIVGGTNLSLHPSKYFSYGLWDMHAADGLCHSFGEGGSGYVSGEGIGAVVLKRLEEAEQDDDRIYGVILGCAINHGGKVSGITVPSPVAQSCAVLDCLADAGVSALALDYIETHGTGTPLGDPIEIQGLQRAFAGRAREDKCAIGSIKSNIGHLEGAAGIAGLTKVLLQLHHQTLVPSLHSSKTNPHIDFAATAFRVQHHTQPWQKADGLLSAGLSSFGASGANAHVIAQQYKAKAQQYKAKAQQYKAKALTAQQYPDAPWVLPLSAQTDERLVAYAKRVLAFVQTQTFELAELLRTMQLGRSVRAAKLLLPAKTQSELTQALQQFITEQALLLSQNPELTGNALGSLPQQGYLFVAENDETPTQLSDTLTARYLSGQEADWAAQWRQSCGLLPSKCQAPLYPFAEQSYWLVESRFGQRDNLSFSLCRDDVVMREHLINGEPVLPGAATIAVVYEAAWRQFKQRPSGFEQLQFIHPVRLSQGQEAVSLVVRFEQNRAEVSVSGQTVFSAQVLFEPVLLPSKKSDIAALYHADKTQVYERWQKAGFTFGANFQVTRQIEAEQNGAKVIVDCQPAPSFKKWSFTGTALPIAALDGVLRSASAPAIAADRMDLRVPASIGGIYFNGLDSDTPVVNAYSRMTTAHTQQSANIDVLDHRGAPYLQVRDFVTVAISSAAIKPEVISATIKAQRTFYFAPAWQPVAIASGEEQAWYPLESGLQRVYFDATAASEPIMAILDPLLSIVQNPNNLVEHYVHIYQEGTLQAAKHQAIIGFVRSLAAVKFKLSVSLIAVKDSAQAQAVICALNTLALPQGLTPLRVVSAAGQRLEFERLGLQPAEASGAFTLSSKGCVVITGGIGGIGYQIARALVARFNVNVALIGRRDVAMLNAKAQSRLAALGAKVRYYSADCADEQALDVCLSAIRCDFGHIVGVFHCAGIENQTPVTQVSQTEFAQVLDARVQGTLLLDKLCADDPLECFVLSSSFAALIGDRGTAAYAYGSAFMDAFAQYRQTTSRPGKTLSVNWPYWRDGGVGADFLEDAQFKAAYFDYAGLDILESDEAIEALFAGLSSDAAQWVVGVGNQDQVRGVIGAIEAKVTSISPKVTDDLTEQTQKWLAQRLAKVFGIEAAQLPPKRGFDHYGIDSIMVMELTKTLGKTFSGLPATLFFERRNLADLTDYFVQHHSARLAEILGHKQATAIGATIQPPVAVAMSGYEVKAQPNDHHHSERDIAVVGMAGQYPKAEDLAAFWQNLHQGVDAIVEIPASRWDWRNVYQDLDSEDLKPWQTNSKWGGFISQIDRFDARFFNFLPVQAEIMDPQARLFLQCVWQAMESATLTRQAFENKTVGVYVGQMWNEYPLLSNQQAVVSQNNASVANLISYYLNLSGPSLTLDTACSSSLYALVSACQAIRAQEVDMAVAGGVNLSLLPNKYISLSQQGFLARDGRCRAFGAGGSGYVPGEGVGAVWLMPLSQAEQGGYPVCGVIKGFALNHGGKTNGATVPNPQAQGQLVYRAIADAGIDVNSIGFIEAHGTGTALGDPIELSALESAFNQAGASKTTEVALGSVKSQIGHLEGAAGIAALHKVLLQFEHGALAPSLHAEVTNPNIDFNTSRFALVRQACPWPENKPYAGISSFGAGGANAHVIVGPYTQHRQAYVVSGPVVIPLSAKTVNSLLSYIAKLAAFIDSTAVNLADLAYTLRVGRACFSERAVFVVSDLAQLKRLLQNYRAEQPLNVAPGVAFAQSHTQQAVERWLSADKFDDTPLQLTQPGNRIACPTYVFDKQSYWIPGADSNRGFTTERQVSLPASKEYWDKRLNDMAVYQQDDAMIGQIEVSCDWPLVAGHMIQDVHAIPAALYAQLAGFIANRLADKHWQIEQIRFIEPGKIDKDKTLQLSAKLFAEQVKVDIAFIEQGAKPRLLCQARLNSHEQKPPLKWSEPQGTAVDIERIYQQFAAAGIDYHQEYRALRQVWRDGDHVFAQLQAEHPSALLDGAIQSAMAFDLDEDTVNRIVYQMQNVQWFGPLTGAAYSLLHRHSVEPKIVHFELAMFDAKGALLLHIADIQSAPLKAAEPIHYVNRWQWQATTEFDVQQLQGRSLVIANDSAFATLFAQTFKHTQVDVLLLDEETQPSVLSAMLCTPYDRVVWRLADKPGLAVATLFDLLKLLVNHDTQELSLWLSCENQFSQQAKGQYSAFVGLISALYAEQLHWQIACLDSDMASDSEHLLLLAQLASEPKSDGHNPVMPLYRQIQGQLYRQQLAPLQSEPHIGQFKQRGAYLIVGGAGGVGYLLSDYLVKHYQAQVVWFGRRAPDQAINDKIAALGAFGPAPLYHQVDCADQAGVQAAFDAIKAQGVVLRGVVISVANREDALVKSMSRAQFERGYGNKAKVISTLMQTTQTLALDFVLCFSSIAGMYGARGAANYAAGCFAENQLCRQWQQQLAAPVKLLHWGYLGEVGTGVGLSDHFKRMGLDIISAKEACQSVELLLGSQLSRLIVCKGSAVPERAELVARFATQITACEGGDFAAIRAAKLAQLPRLQQDFSAHAKTLEYQYLKRVLTQFDAQGWLVRLAQLPLNGAASPQQSQQLFAELGVLPKYYRWMQEILGKLHLSGLSLTSKALMADTDWQQLLQSFKDNRYFAAQVHLVDISLNRLCAMLCGQVSAPEVLFAQGSAQYVERIYKDNPISDHFNRYVAERAAALAKQGGSLNVLEIGAGTGGTSAKVIPALAACGVPVRYVYSDISASFFSAAKAQFGHYEFVEFETLDIEKPFNAQSAQVAEYAKQGFDLVFATNALHATGNIHHTMAQTKALLKKGGELIVNEMSENSLFATLTFGLLDGWWLFEDSALRLPGCPGLAAEKWQQVLSLEGYRNISHPLAPAHHLGQQIVVAQSDGLMVQAQTQAQIKAKVTAKSVTAVNTDDKNHTNASVEQALAKVICEVTGLASDALCADTPFEQLGIDSIVIGQLNKRLSKVFSALEATVLFEYFDIASLAGYLTQAFPEQCAAWAGPEPVSVKAPLETSLDMPAIEALSQSIAATDAVTVAEEASTEGIAVIGLAGHYPGAQSLDEFWQLLNQGRSAITTIPQSRWDWAEYYHQDKQLAAKLGKSYSKWGGFISRFNEFDGQFFNIAPREAVNIDPQERLFLQTCTEVLEDAGVTRQRLKQQFANDVGVFVGVTKNSFQQIDGDLTSRFSPLSFFWSVANRISWQLDLTGPSYAVDTACSSSLTALDNACQALQTGRCQMAIAGGVNLYLHPQTYVSLCGKQMLSSDDKCRSFGIDADGFVPGEGVGAVLLRPLKAAIADKDPIYGVIRATAVNHGGKTNGFTVPSPQAQGRLIAATLKQAGLKPEDIGYIEAHGTGTSLGDPIEVKGLVSAFGNEPQRPYPCALGSVKANIGHLESAAGIAALSKVLLQFKHRTLVPTINAQVVNPVIDFERTPFALVQSSQPWRGPMRAGISAFGAGGSNAHVIVEAYQRQTRHAYDEQMQLFPVSCHTPGTLWRYLKRLSAQLAKAENALADVAYTLQHGRDSRSHRIVFIAQSVQALLDLLEQVLAAGEQALPLGQWVSQAAVNDTLLTCAQNWLANNKVSWPQSQGQMVHLPARPFERKVHWHQAQSKTYATAQSSAPVQPRQVAVIGAGPAGLVSAKSLLEQGFEPVIFEKSDRIGGIWADRADGSGIAYASVKFQTSKYISHFSDMPIAAATTHACFNEIRDYLKAYADKHDLYRFIRFNCEVLAVDELPRDSGEPVLAGRDNWQLRYQSKGQTASAAFFAVAVCSGPFNRPNRPVLTNEAAFGGQIIHSSQFYEPSIFQGKTVVVVGNGVSGMDIAVNATQTADKVYLSIKTAKWIMKRMSGFVPNDASILSTLQLQLDREGLVRSIAANMPSYYQDLIDTGLKPDDRDFNQELYINDDIVAMVKAGRIELIPSIDSLSSTGVVLSDGRHVSTDSIVLATGYQKPDLSFIHTRTGETLDVLDCYRCQLYRHNPTLSLMDLARVNISALTISEIQGRYFAQLLSGKLPLPKSDEMAAQVAQQSRDICYQPNYLAHFAWSIGHFPDPIKQWSLYWQLLCLPFTPTLFRMVGENRWAGAEQHLAQIRRRCFINPQSEANRQVKIAVLAALGEAAIAELYRQGDIEQSEYHQALAYQGPQLSDVPGAPQQPPQHRAQSSNTQLSQLMEKIKVFKSDVLTSTSNGVTSHD